MKMSAYRITVDFVMPTLGIVLGITYGLHTGNEWAWVSAGWAAAVLCSSMELMDAEELRKARASLPE